MGGLLWIDWGQPTGNGGVLDLFSCVSISRDVRFDLKLSFLGTTNEEVQNFQYSIYKVMKIIHNVQ
jgi:hypothetical protein